MQNNLYFMVIHIKYMYKYALLSYTVNTKINAVSVFVIRLKSLQLKLFIMLFQACSEGKTLDNSLFHLLE